MQMRFCGTSTWKLTDDRDCKPTKKPHEYVSLGRVWVEPLNIRALIVTPRKLETLGKTQARPQTLGLKQNWSRRSCEIPTLRVGKEYASVQVPFKTKAINLFWEIVAKGRHAKQEVNKMKTFHVLAVSHLRRF